MKTFRFYKEEDNRWYIDLPNWTGSKADLEMVSGADTMLEHISEGNSESYINISDKHFNESDELEFVRLAREFDNGAFYSLQEYNGVKLNLDVWLCDVTKFVFGYFPSKIFISKSDVSFYNPNEIKSNEIDFNSYFQDTSKEINRRPIIEVLQLFDNGYEKYNLDPIFRQTIDYLCLGGAPEKIINNLIDIINSQQKEIERLSK